MVRHSASQNVIKTWSFENGLSIHVCSTIMSAKTGAKKNFQKKGLYTQDLNPWHWLVISLVGKGDATAASARYPPS